MCRKNILWGGLLIAFGAGLVTGYWIEGGFLCHLFSVAAIIIGGCVCRGR